MEKFYSALRGKAMNVEKPIEDTYVTELVSVINQIGEPIGFNAESNWKTPSGRPDIKLYYKGKVVAVIEVKRPEIPLSDPKLNKQALKYADWYRKQHRVNFYGIHNMKYLKLSKYVAGEKQEKTLLDFMGEERANWASISDFPFKIMPWVKSINEFKQISTTKQARKNLDEFMLGFKEILEGKTLDLSKDVIETVRRYIEDGASKGLPRLEYLYKSKEKNVTPLFEEWRKERGIKRPKNDNQLREFLTLMLKEQLYTFSMKVLFYLVLQGIDAEMSARLKENLAAIEPSDSEIFKKIFDILFSYAIDRTGDFEEVFGTNTVDRLPCMEATLHSMKELISYLNQVRWSEINIDVIGRIFEGLIYTERRHLLGQHYTDTIVVDLILAATLRKPRTLIDPACGSGTFLVRALNYWKANYGSSGKNYALVEGIDIDKLASMLSKMNLYIQALERIKEKIKYYPKILHHDFFKAKLLPNYSYVVTNPPYTRQEEMVMAFYDKDYKKNLTETVKDIANWSKRASIYAYFLIGGAKLLKESGRLGFVVENSWLNAEYGAPLKNWFLNNSTIEYVIESLVERWFEDAKVITNIIIAQNTKSVNYVTKFIYLKKRLRELFGAPPPANDFVANQRYYEKISDLLSRAKNVSPKHDYVIYEDNDARIVSIRKKLLEKIEKKLGKWGIFKGSKKYLEIVLDFLECRDQSLRMLDDVLSLKYGIKTNGNEIFYLPSKYWRFLDEDEKRLTLGGPTGKSLKISKRYLKPLIRTAHIRDVPYRISLIDKRRHEDYLLWVEDTRKVEDSETREYLEWATDFIKQEYETSAHAQFPTLKRKIDSPRWTKLSDVSGGLFLFKNAVSENFSILLNGLQDAQVDLRLYAGYHKKTYSDIDPRITFASLNSILTYLGMELMGRTSLGEGALDVKVTDYETILVVDPLILKQRLKEKGELQGFLQIVDEMLDMKPVNIEAEAENSIRLKMEEYVLGSLGLSKKDILSLYKELMTLVNLRAERAVSVKKKS